MKVQWWSCMLALFSMPTGIILTEWKAYQHPSSTSFVKMNSSTDISCSTSLSKPLGLNLIRQFLNNASILYLSLDNGQISKATEVAEFAGRVHVYNGPHIKQGHSFTLRLSPLRVEDTDLYYCSWSYYNNYIPGHLTSNGTVIIVRETNPAEACASTGIDLAIICLTIATASSLVILGIGALIYQCTRFKKLFTPEERMEPPTSCSHQLVAPEQPIQHCPYMITGVRPPPGCGADNLLSQQLDLKY